MFFIVTFKITNLLGHLEIKLETRFLGYLGEKMCRVGMFVQTSQKSNCFYLSTDGKAQLSIKNISEGPDI